MQIRDLKMIHNILLRLLDLSLRLPTPPPQDSTLPNEQVRMQRRVRNRRRPTVSGVAILDTQQLVGSPVEERIRTAVADMLELLPAGVDLDTPFKAKFDRTSTQYAFVC